MGRSGVAIVLGITLAGMQGASASTLTAQQVMERLRQLNESTRKWTDRQQRVEMSTLRKEGTLRRELQVYEHRDETGRQSISFLLAPAEVKGMSFLQVSRSGERSDRWLYVPGSERRRRIAPGESDESFLGSALTYQELDVLGRLNYWSEAEAPRKMVGAESIDGVPCHVIELRPEAEDIRARRITLWLEQEALVPRRLQFFDEDDELITTIALNDVRTIGAVPTAHRIEVSARNGASSVFTYRDVKYDVGLPPDLFTVRHMDHGGP